MPIITKRFDLIFKWVCLKKLNGAKMCRPTASNVWIMSKGHDEDWLMGVWKEMSSTLLRECELVKRLLCHSWLPGKIWHLMLSIFLMKWAGDSSHQPVPSVSKVARRIAAIIKQCGVGKFNQTLEESGPEMMDCRQDWSEIFYKSFRFQKLDESASTVSFTHRVASLSATRKAKTGAV